jgi:hypothetical protein
MSEKSFYVIAHHCNNRGDIEKVLKKGANAIECDVSYGEKDDKWCVNHDGYYPKSSMMLDEWFEEIYNAPHRNRLCFVYLDIKSKTHLDNLISSVHLCTKKFIEKEGRIPVPVIYSIDDFKVAEKQFLATAGSLKNWEGFNVDFENDPDTVNDKYKKIIEHEKVEGRSFNRFFYSDGISVLSDKSVRRRVARGCQLRDCEQVFKKIFSWTIDKESTALEYLHIGVDGIMTDAGTWLSIDCIDNILNAINVHNKTYPENAVRIATPDDNLFEVYGSEQ